MTNDYQDIINRSIEVLSTGGTILYPTDTIWGIGCDATNTNAISRIYHIKKRNESKSLIILVTNTDQLRNYVEDIPVQAAGLIQAAIKPLTIIYDKAKDLPDSLIADDGSIAIRIVQDDFCRELIKQLGKPIVSTSANISGAPAPASFTDISNEIKKQANYIVPLKQGQEGFLPPSSIVRCKADGTTEVIRK